MLSKGEVEIISFSFSTTNDNRWKKKKKKKKKKKERKKERKDTSKNTIRCKFSLAEEEYSLLRSKQRQLGKGRDEREK